MTEKEESRRYIHRYIPSLIVKEWTESDGRVKTVTRESEEFVEKDAEEVFIEECVKESEDGTGSDYDPFSDTVLSSALSSLVKGEEDDSLLTLTAAALLVLDIYLSTCGICRNKEKTGKGEQGNGKYDEIKRMLPYLMALRYTTVETDLSWMQFILADHPLYVDNLLFPDNGTDGVSPLLRRGLIVIFPLTPQRALLLYDSSAYWLHSKEDGSTVLTFEDMRRVNRKIMKESGMAVVHSFDDEGCCSRSNPEHFREYWDDYRYVTFPLSFLSVRPGAEENVERIREGVKALNEADAAGESVPDDYDTLGERISIVLRSLREGRR